MDYFRHILATGQTYHIFNRSIIGNKVFKEKRLFDHFLQSMKYYQLVNPPLKLSYFLATAKKPILNKKEKLIENLCYCLMPNHFHIILTQIANNGISIFMNRLLNSYTHFFNTKYKRKGPLWEGRFKRVRINSDEQLLHLTRYIHLNPVTNFLVKNPLEYPFSSYKEYLKIDTQQITNPVLVLGKNYSIKEYKKFILNQKDYQRELKKIKDELLE